MMIFNYLRYFVLFVTVNCYIVDPGPFFKGTKGEIWPLPENQTKSQEYFVIRPHIFQFMAVNKDCGILQQAINRYWQILNTLALVNFGSPEKLENDIYRKHKYNKIIPKDGNFLSFLDVLNVNLTGECKDDDFPHYNMVENYILRIDKDKFELESESIWGILRGLESFSQLVHYHDDTITLIVNSTVISDRPRYSHRGLLLDTSRHFIPVKQVLENLDAMAYNKLNVFHWHITDDQSFPYESIKFPNISEKGAYHPISKVYHQNEIKDIIEYARVRGIRVLPEFDTPGHTRSWGEAMTSLLTACYDKSNPTGQYGPIDPSKNSTYDFLKEFFEEVVKVFPDNYLHLGGDEVGFECWQSNPEINKFMEQIKIPGDYAALESYYIDQLIEIVKNMNTNFIVWEEVFTNGVDIPKETIVHVWIDNDYKKTLSNVTAEGKHTILSACYYLDHLSTGGDWLKYYICDPGNFTATDAQKELVIGGEAAMWSEVVNEYNVISRIWPRASAVAERLWSKNAPNLNLDENGTLNIIQLAIDGLLTPDITQLAKRLEEHTCRMNKRGIAAEPPSGPGVCL